MFPVSMEPAWEMPSIFALEVLAMPIPLHRHASAMGGRIVRYFVAYIEKSRI